MQNPAVLVVEDSPAQQLYAGQLLKQLKIQHISYACDGELALELLKHNRADVVMIDLEMNRMNGVELLRTIAKQQLCRSVIIASAKDPLLLTSVATMAEADGLQVLGTLAKPVSKDLLQLCLLRWQATNPDFTAATHPSQHSPLRPSPDKEQLLEALQQQQFSLCYQPIVCAKTGLVVTFEALARWHKPDADVIAPDVFIAAAERLGLINQLTLQLLELALPELKLWQQPDQPAVLLSFNLSALSLSDQDFIQQLLHKVAQHGLAPELICWEVTETHDFTELAAAIHGMATLRLNGCSVAIDDYGTGFANAQQLSRIPATRLKLDRSLVQQVSQRPQQRLVLENTVQLAHKLGLTLVAEGVELEADYQILQKLGIEFFQGYLFSRPVVAAGCVRQMQVILEQTKAA